MSKTLDVLSRVRGIVAEVIGVDLSEVSEQSHFINDLGADSLDTVELVMALEEEFDIEVPDESAEMLQTVGQVVDWLEERGR